MQLWKIQECSHTFIRNVIRDLDWPDVDIIIGSELKQDRTNADPHGLAFTSLPVLTCVAAGGKAMQAIPLAASWRLYLLAATVFDDIADDDKPDALWSRWDVGRAMNVGLGLLFAAQTCLARIDANAPARADIQDSVGRALMLMARGQTYPPIQPALDLYFQHILSKSALFFAVFARAGARVHSRSSSALQAMFDFGLAFGTLRQIRNDVQNLASPQMLSDLESGVYTLPVIYALSCTDHPDHPRLRTLLDARQTWTKRDRGVICRILANMGVLTQCTAMAKIYGDKARHALRLFPPRRMKPLETLALGEEEMLWIP
jgi:octaprenyl-diphosphate synthase